MSGFTVLATLYGKYSPSIVVDAPQKKAAAADSAISEASISTTIKLPSSYYISAGLGIRERGCGIVIVGVGDA
jgi:hypothetical protein